MHLLRVPPAKTRERPIVHMPLPQRRIHRRRTTLSPAIPAVRAPRRLMLQTPSSKERLLTRSEHKSSAAITANNRAIGVWHRQDLRAEPRFVNGAKIAPDYMRAHVENQ